MEVETKEIRNEALADAATGAVVGLAQAAAEPVRTAQREVRKLERRGAPVNRQLERKAQRSLEQAVETAGEVVDGTIPERVLLSGIRLVRQTARRRDLVGDVAYRTLKVLNGGLEATLKTLNRFESASEPPVRPSRGSSRRSPRAGVARRAPSTTRAGTRRGGRSRARTTRRPARRGA